MGGPGSGPRPGGGRRRKASNSVVKADRAFFSAMRSKSFVHPMKLAKLAKAAGKARQKADNKAQKARWSRLKVRKSK